MPSIIFQFGLSFSPLKQETASSASSAVDLHSRPLTTRRRSSHLFSHPLSSVSSIRSARSIRLIRSPLTSIYIHYLRKTVTSYELESITQGFIAVKMAVQSPRLVLPAMEVSFPVRGCPLWQRQAQLSSEIACRTLKLRISALSGGDNSSSGKKAPVSNTIYVVPLDKSSCITRPLNEILRDLNKRILDTIIKTQDDNSTFIPWYQANRMLSFYAPGWCGEIRDVIFSENGNVTVVYRVTVRGSDGEAHRESTGTVSPGEDNGADLVAAAEEIAFCRACARFGLGLYLYHED